MKKFRIAAWVAVAVAGCAFLILNVMPSGQGDSRDDAGITVSSIGGPFRLISHKGTVVDSAQLLGKPYMVFFGFTHCPDVCPTTLFELSTHMKEMGAQADQFQVLFITVDPARDTQEMLATYMSSFDERITALRGTQDETDAVVKEFAAFAKKVPTEGDQYTMDHTAGVYMMDRRGRLAGMLDFHESPTVRKQKLERFAANAAVQ